MGSLIRQFQLATIIKFHHGKQRCGSLCQRSQVEQIRRTHSSGILIGMYTEAFIIHRLTVFQHQHLAAGISSGSQSCPHDSINAMQLIGLHPQILGNNTSRLHPRSDHTSLTGLIKTSDTHGKFALGRHFGKDDTCHILLDIRFRRMSQHYGAGLVQSRL